MPLTSQTPRAPAKKKKSKKERKATQEAPARASSPVPGKSKTSGRKFQTVALTISEDASRAVINRLPPSAPPEDLEEFDQNRWLEQQLALTQQMMQLYTEDGSGNTACPYIGGAADEDDDSDDGWREDEEAAEALKSAEQRQHDPVLWLGLEPFEVAHGRTPDHARGECAREDLQDRLRVAL